MPNYPLNQKPVLRSEDLEPLAIFFFFLGAIDIYTALKQKFRQSQEKTQDRLRRNQGLTWASYGQVTLLVLIITGIVEITLF